MAPAGDAAVETRSGPGSAGRPPVVDAVLLAGGAPAAGDPLHPLTRGGPKALLAIAGRPMIQWVLDALGAARTIRRVIVVGLAREDARLACAKPLTFVADQGSLIANLKAGGRAAQSQSSPPSHALAVSADVPLLTAPVVDWIVRAARETDHEAYYVIVPRAAMERRFPASGRSFVGLREGGFAGGDLSLFKLTLLREHHPVWEKLVAARKSRSAQARLLGLDVLLLLAIGRLGLARLERRVRARLGVDACGLVCPHAEAAMDVDKPHQYEMLSRVLAGGR
jgi:molybdopterin-guanine dinucleotide biosynthesis protein A